MVKSKRLRKKTSLKIVKLTLSILSIIFLLTLSAFISYQYNKVKSYNNLIYPGVCIEGIDVSGKTKEEANKILNQQYWEKVLNKKINIQVKNKIYTLKYEELKPTNNLDKVLNNALSYGKNLIIFKRYSLIKNKTPKNVSVNFKYNEKVIDSLISKIEKDVNLSPVDARLTLQGNGFNVISHRNGEKLDKEKLKKDLVFNINDEISNDITEKAIMKTIKPRITEEKLQGVNKQIGSYSSHYGSISSPQRANNIAIATSAINGKVLMPGDVFSFNGVVGPRTQESGYQAAPVIIGDKVEDGLGGGVCQVSSALFNAISNCSLESIEMSHHTKPVHYVKEGMDATVDYGNIDYKFKNNLQGPIYIQSYTSNGNVVFNIYSRG